MWDFVRHSDIGLPFLIDYLNTWERNVAQLERAAMVRYEDLRAEPGATLRRIARLIGETFTDAEIREAVDFGSFDNLKKLESRGFFRQGGLTLRNPADPESFKVRRAKVGGLSGLLHRRAGGRARGTDGRAAVADLRLPASGGGRPRRGLTRLRAVPRTCPAGCGWCWATSPATMPRSRQWSECSRLGLRAQASPVAPALCDREAAIPGLARSRRPRGLRSPGAALAGSDPDHRPPAVDGRTLGSRSSPPAGPSWSCSASHRA